MRRQKIHYVGIGLLALLLTLPKLGAENCSDCPFNSREEQHHELLKWADFHCHQIRVLRERINRLEKLAEQVEHLEKMIQLQQEKIQFLEEESW